MNKIYLTDILFKLISKITDYVLFLKWKLLLGRLGKKSYLRKGVCIIGNPKRIYVGNGFKIYQKTIISIGRGVITIGNNGLLGVGCYINCGNEKIIIGDNVAIGPYCKIFSYSHHYSQGMSVTDSFRNADVIIGNNVLIGSNSVILPGVTIGDNVVIGASSVVNSDVASNSVVAGNLASFIKNIK